MSAPFRELQKPLDDLAVLCRGCLAQSGQMKNMYEWGLAETFAKVTEIQLKPDSQSVLLCTLCEETLIVCLNFRKQCQNAHDVLMHERVNPKESEPDIQDIQENIVTPMLYNNKVVFNIVAPDTVSKIYLPCMYCSEKYIKQKDLMIHLAKMHNIDSKTYVVEAKYYCHVKTCTYFINSSSDDHFLGRKNLNQHFVKVHKANVLQCSYCNMNFPTESYLDRHMKICNQIFVCNICTQTYKTNERLMVHLLRKHPDEHKRYKDCKKLKRKSYLDKVIDYSLPKSAKNSEHSLPEIIETETSESVLNLEENNGQSQKEKSALEKFAEFINDSPKRSFATQTKLEHNIRNDVTLPPWQTKSDEIIISTSTQTDIFDDLLSLKSQNSEDESIFFSESVSLSDIQTQTFPLEFGLSRSNKETLTSETQSPDLSMKETQTCVCLYDSPKLNSNRYFDSVTYSPINKLTSTETQTADYRTNVKSDVLLSFNSTETQTSFDENGHEKVM